MAPMLLAELARLAARRREQQREQRNAMPDMSGFMAWRDEVAARRRAANGDDNEQLLMAPAQVAQVAAPPPVAADQPAQPADDVAACSAATPATGYQLPAPPPFPPRAASRAELREQVAVTQKCILKQVSVGFLRRATA